MFHRYDKLKRVIALLGVTLALSSTFQHTHFFCLLAGCTPAAAAQVAETGSCTGKTCPYSKGHDANCTDDILPLHDCSTHDCKESVPHQCPCPQTCWCHQPADPFELPRSTPEPTELLVLGPVYLKATSLSISKADQLSRNAMEAALDWTAKSAPQVCAELCRYLT